MMDADLARMLYRVRLGHRSRRVRSAGFLRAAGGKA